METLQLKIPKISVTPLVGTVVLLEVLGYRNSVNGRASRVCSCVFPKLTIMCSPTWVLNCRGATAVSMMKGADLWDSCVHSPCAYDTLSEFQFLLHINSTTCTVHTATTYVCMYIGPC